MTARRGTAAVGVVLAGGASRRMGRDKTRLELDGESLVARAARLLRHATPDVVIADRERSLVAGYRSLADGPGAGPAAGILGAAAKHPGRDLLVLACDLPSVPPALLRRLAAPIDGGVLVPRWRCGVEPLCARYRPSALAVLAAEVAAGRFALHRLLRLDDVAARYLDGPELAAFGRPEVMFHNLNRPEDLDAAAPRGGLPIGR